MSLHYISHIRFISARRIVSEFHTGHAFCSKKPAKEIPHGYYEVLGIPRTSRLSDVKSAYLRIAKKHHPDKAGENLESRAIFDEATEAYQTLMDPNQKNFYDTHGYPSEELRKRGIPSIFDYRPKYSIYEATMKADNETSALEDWFAAQGHSVKEPNFTDVRQRLKNAYIEFRYGLLFFGFPWRIRAFFNTLGIWIVAGTILLTSFSYYMRFKHDQAPRNDPTRPLKFNDMWEVQEMQNDFLGYMGLRNKSPHKETKEEKGSNVAMPIIRVKESREERLLNNRIAGLKHRLSMIEEESQRIKATLKKIDKSYISDEKPVKAAEDIQ